MSDNAILFLHAITSLHPGSGTALGSIDLPVQRERHTDWPVIPGSSIKGVLRAACSSDPGDSDAVKKLVTVFGPDSKNSDAHAGALRITDARILLFPVRSLNGLFGWITCPAALDAYKRALRISGRSVTGETPQPAPGTAIVCATSPLRVGERRNKIVLEEYDFDVASPSVNGPNWDWLATLKLDGDETTIRLKQHYAVLDDTYFQYFVKHATEVVARIALETESKTVKSGALFYEEYLPPETVFYSMVFAEASHNNECVMGSNEVLAYADNKIEKEKYLQIGGDETTGKGICAVSFYTAATVEETATEQ